MGGPYNCNFIHLSQHQGKHSLPCLLHIHKHDNGEQQEYLVDFWFPFSTPINKWLLEPVALWDKIIMNRNAYMHLLDFRPFSKWWFPTLHMRGTYIFKIGGMYILLCFIPYRHYPGLSKLTMGPETSNSKIQTTVAGKYHINLYVSPAFLITLQYQISWIKKMSCVSRSLPLYVLTHFFKASKPCSPIHTFPPWRNHFFIIKKFGNAEVSENISFISIK